MKFTFAAACLLGVTLADQEFALADDRGLDNNNVIPADKSEDENGFKLDWNVGGGQGVFVDPEDGEGWEIRNTYYYGGAELSIYKQDLYDPTIFEGTSSVVFNVGVAGQWPDYGDSYDVYMVVTCADGSVINENDRGTATQELKNIRLEANTSSCDITNVKIGMNGQDVEYWAGTYGAFWKDMDLYV